MPSCFFLGTGPGEPVPERFNSSALLDAGPGRLLIDAGEPAAQRLVAHGMDLEKIDGVLITHGHADHCGGLPMLIQAMQVGGRRRALPVWMPRGLVGPFSAWLNACCLFPPLIGFDLHFAAWEDGEAAPGGVRTSQVVGLEVDAVRNTHLNDARDKYERLPDGSFTLGQPCFNSFSLRVRHPDWTAVFSSDIAAPTDFAALCDPPPDLLVCEMSHIVPGEIVDLLNNTRPRRVAINHVKPGMERRLIELLKPDGPIPVLVADGDLIAFP